MQGRKAQLRTSLRTHTAHLSTGPSPCRITIAFVVYLKDKHARETRRMRDNSSTEHYELDEDKVQRVAAALYNHALNTVRAQVEATDCKPERLSAILELARNETDRSAAILIFSMAEDILHDAYTRLLNPDLKGGINTLLDGNGALATAHNRIAMAAALRWIGPLTYKSLGLLRQIRNRFAHDVDATSFDDERISGWITSLHKYEDAAVSALPHIAKKLSLREQFLARSALCLHDLVRELIVMPPSQTAKVDWQHVTSSWDTTPKNLQELSRIFARFTLDLLHPA